MNPEFKRWLEQQTYEYVRRKQTGDWKVIDEEYNNGTNFNWYNVIHRYRILERVRQLNK
jgi:hypothetical protein